MEILRNILIFLLFMNFLFANNVDLLKAEIIESISDIFIKKEIKKIFIDSKYFNSAKSYLNYPYRSVSYITEADLLILDKISFKIDKPVLLTSYLEYIKYKKEDIAGAFFWQKGRPVLILNRLYLEKHHIKVPKHYQSYIR